MKRSVLMTWLLCLVVGICQAAPPEIGVHFKKVQLHEEYISEGASVGDINNDGKMDVVAGPLWWEGPDFKKVHSYAPFRKFLLKGPGLSAYSDNFFTFPDRITRDEWVDILKVGIPGEPAKLAVNPGEKPFDPANTEHSCEHCKVQDNICNESPQYVDILPDTPPQLLSFSKNHIALAHPGEDPTKPWVVLNITPKDGAFGRFVHGLGVGDINGDGLEDVLEKRGWWEQPKDWDRKSVWTFHPFAFAPQQGGAQMFAYDIDGDGDNDVVTALNAHAWGMAWYEQVPDGKGGITFQAHTVMTDKADGNPYGVSFSQPHAMACADIDGDGIKDVVTGKCYYAHNGKDPGAEDPAVLYWFRTVRKEGKAELVPYLIDIDSGVGRQITAADVNGDKKIDIITSNKKGTFVFLQTDTPQEPVKLPEPNKPEAAQQAQVGKKSANGGLLFEGESLAVAKRTGSVRPQDLRGFGNVWSNHSHVWWTGSKPGDAIEFSLPVAAAGSYRIGVGLTKAIDYGIVEFSLDGRKIAGPVDLYNNGVIHAGTSPLGEVHALESGTHRLGVKIVGANPKALKSYMFGLDYVILHPGTKQELLEARKTARHQPVNAVPQGGRPARGNVKQGNDLGAEVRAPSEQLQSFKLPEGFVMELVSSEEQGLVKPISLAFDDAGRLWTQTAREYPKDKDAGAFKNGGADQILVFDTPWAKGVQTPRVFAEGLTMPVSVLPHEDRVLAIHGPELLEFRDTDGDGKADERKSLMSGFGIQDTHTTVHQLARGPGGWIHVSQGCNASGRVTTADGKQVDFNNARFGRFKPDGTRFELTGAGMNNVWCWAMDGVGRVFVHEANDLGYSQAVFEQDVTYPSFRKVSHFPESPPHPPTAQDLGLGGTGFSGIAVSEDGVRGFPEAWQNMNFVANPITRAINTVTYTRDADGVYQFKRGEDLVTSDDQMFRPVAIEFGPDGCLYIIDWYNRIISHNEVDRNHPARDKVSGRIWRVRHASQKPVTPPNVEAAATKDLLKHLASGNLWERRAAWRQIVQRDAREHIPALNTLCQSGSGDESLKIHALWCLEELGYFEPGLWRALLSNPDEHVRFQAVRALGTLQPDLAIAYELLKPLADDASRIVVNEILRFFRDTPQRHTEAHRSLVRGFIVPDEKLPKGTVKGWKGSYLAMGGPYEAVFTNLLAGKALNREAPVEPGLDLSKWNKTIAKHPPLPAKQAEELAKKIEGLSGAYARLGGDAAKGLTHFQARCAACHGGVEGMTGFVPPLAGGASRTPESVLTSVLNPNVAVETVFNAYRVVKKDGTTVEGFRSDLTKDGVELTFFGGGKLKVPLAEIRDAGYVDGKSFMMEGTSAGMSDADLLDLVAYIRSIK